MMTLKTERVGCSSARQLASAQTQGTFSSLQPLKHIRSSYTSVIALDLSSFCRLPVERAYVIQADVVPRHSDQGRGISSSVGDVHECTDLTV